MATELNLSSNPIRGLKRELRSLKAEKGSGNEVLKSVVESNAQSQHRMSQVLSSLNELVGALNAAGEEDAPEKSHNNGELKDIKEKLDKVIEQNFHLINTINELVKHLKGAPHKKETSNTNWPGYRRL